MKSERLRSLREKMGLSQLEAAKKMGIVRTTYSNYEAGNREPDNDTLKKFSDFFEVSIDYLLGNDSNKSLNNDQAKNDELYEIISRLPPDKIESLLKFLKDT